MSSFQVGEVAIGQNHVIDIELNGMECVIIEPLQFAMAHTSNGEIMVGNAYQVQWADGRRMYAEPRYLRKKQPPAADESTAHQAMLDCIERAKQSAKEPA